MCAFVGRHENVVQEFFSTSTGFPFYNLIKCVEHIPADKTKTLAEVREWMEREILKKKVQLEIPTVFKQLNDAGTTIVQVTHSEVNASYGNRVIQIEDGWIA